jgi:hypothetical protein
MLVGVEAPTSVVFRHVGGFGPDMDGGQTQK